MTKLAIVIGIMSIMLAMGGTSARAQGGAAVVTGSEQEILERFQGSAPRKVFSILGEQHEHGLRMTVAEKPSAPWAAGAKVLNDVPMQKGGHYRVRFLARSGKSGEKGQANFMVKQAGPPYGDVQAEKGLLPGGQWEVVDVPFTATRDFDAKAAQFEFHLGYKAQVLEIAGFEVRQTDSAAPAAPVKLDYDGRAADAPWRAAAAERIRQHRMGDLTVRVVDAAGKPVEGAQVKAAMTRHAYHFGTAVPADQLFKTGADADQFRKHLVELFNYATIENHLKLDIWQDPKQRETALRAVQWLHERGFTQRGHTLVWWVKYGQWNIPMNDGELMSFMRSHITQMLGDPLLQKAILDWDVQNEASHNSPVYNRIKVDGLADLFKLAEATHPAGRMFINDAKIESQQVPKHAHHEDFHYNLAKDLVDRGAPLEGIGFQHHHDGLNLTPMHELTRIMDRFATFGVPLQATEFDIKTARVANGQPLGDAEVERLEADYTRDLMTLWFSHPATDAFIMWGFWDGRHWKDSAPLFRKDWSMKPSGEAYKRLVLTDWWTNATGATDVAGQYRTRGFLGDYDLAVTTSAGQTKQATARIERGGSEVVITLD